MKRTGQSKIAVVGWGRGMGHTGHMYLADAVIQQANDMNADPYFFVSKTVGKDDPIFPEEKVRIYQKVFPQHATIFEPQGNLNQALTDLAGLGYQGVVVVVGADQKQAFQYLVNPNKEGVPVYQTMGLKKLKVISRQETRSQFAHEEGPRATPMREILLDPTASEEDKFKVWRRDMPEQLGDRDVLDIMNKAESRMLHAPAKQSKVKQMSQKVDKLKEATQPQEDDSIGYMKYFAKPTQPNKPKEQRFHSWDEYEQNKNPQKQPEPELEESLIMDRNAKINAYYISSQGKKHKVAEGIPYYLLDKLVSGLTKKYNITMNDIEVRPADASQYRRSSQPELAEGVQCNPNEVAELLYNAKPEIFSRFGDDFVMDAIAQACEQHTGSAQEVAVKVVDILKQGIDEGRKANTKAARKEFGARPRKENPAEQDAKKKESDEAWQRLMQYAADQKKENELEESPEEALKYATKAHAGQTRSGGDPYISHPVRVANHIKQFKQSHNLDALISAAYLHDTIEDTDTTQEILHDLFGGLVASLVKELTSDPEEIKKVGKAQYLSHKMAAMSSYALVIKLADRLDNVKDITTTRTPQWRAKYAAETNQILNYIEKTRALSGTHNKLIELIRAKLAEIDNPQQGVAEGADPVKDYQLAAAKNYAKAAKVAKQKGDNVAYVRAMLDYHANMMTHHFLNSRDDEGEKHEAAMDRYEALLNQLDPQGLAEGSKDLIRIKDGDGHAYKIPSDMEKEFLAMWEKQFSTPYGSIPFYQYNQAFHSKFSKYRVNPINKEDVDEAYDHNAPFNAADFNRHMAQLRAREELRKTDPMKALVGDLIDKEHEKEQLAKRKKPEDDSIGINDPRHPGYAYTQAGHQGVAEGEPRRTMGLDASLDQHFNDKKHLLNPGVARPGQLVQIIKAPRMLDLLPGETFEVRTSDPEGVTLKHGLGTKFDNVKFPHGTYKITKAQGVAEAGITRRGILKGIGAAAAAGAAGKASAIAGAFPTPSHQAAMYKAAADSNAAQARADAAAKAKADAKRLQQGTQDVERLNKVNYHGGNSPKPTNATWDGDSDFLDLDGTQYAKASRMPISGDVPSDLTLVSTKEGRQVYLWTRRSLKGTQGHYFYPAEKPNTINEFAPGNGDGDDEFTTVYQVYQCQLNDQFDWIGGPLFQSKNLGKAHSAAYEMWKKYPDKCFMVWQPNTEASRGGYGPKGSVLGADEDDVTENSDYIDEK